MKIFLANDHAATEIKTEVISFLKQRGMEVINLGTDANESVHYPEYAIKLAKSVSNEDAQGILICGSGIGVSMVANKFKGVRAALCKSSEEAVLAKQHNNANVLCLGARFSTIDEIKAMISNWLDSEFEGGRHQSRIDMFNDLGSETN